MESVIAATLEKINADLEELKTEIQDTKAGLLSGYTNQFLMKEFDRLTGKEAELIKQRGQIIANLSLPS